MRRRAVRTLSELAPLRRAAYCLFGALFLYPDEGRLAAVRDASGALRRYDASVARLVYFPSWRRLLTFLEDLPFDEAPRVQEEYVGLFQVNPEAPPYESLYTDPNPGAGGRVAAQLAREYADAGLALSPSLKEPPDAAAVELEFMAFLCEEEAHAWDQGAQDDGMRALARQQRFLDQHLGRWFPAFARHVRTAAPGGFYAIVAEAADAFVHHDGDLLDLVLQRARTAAGPEAGTRTAEAAG